MLFKNIIKMVDSSETVLYSISFNFNSYIPLLHLQSNAQSEAAEIGFISQLLPSTTQFNRKSFNKKTIKKKWKWRIAVKPCYTRSPLSLFSYSLPFPELEALDRCLDLSLSWLNHGIYLIDSSIGATLVTWKKKAMAKDLHPKLLAGMFFFSLRATGGVTSLLTSDKPILESPHAVTGLIGLTLLAIQTALPTLFEGNPGLRNVHGILGSGIVTLFLVHAALGLQLGLSF